MELQIRVTFSTARTTEIFTFTFNVSQNSLLNTGAFSGRLGDLQPQLWSTEVVQETSKMKQDKNLIWKLCEFLQALSIFFPDQSTKHREAARRLLYSSLAPGLPAKASHSLALKGMCTPGCSHNIPPRGVDMFPCSKKRDIIHSSPFQAFWPHPFWPGWSQTVVKCPQSFTILVIIQSCQDSFFSRSCPLWKQNFSWLKCLSKTPVHDSFAIQCLLCSAEVPEPICGSRPRNVLMIITS